MRDLYNIWVIIARFITDQEETQPSAGNSKALQILILDRLFDRVGDTKIDILALRTMEPYESVTTKNMNNMLTFFNRAILARSELSILRVQKNSTSATKNCLTKGLTEEDLNLIHRIENSFAQKSKKGRAYNKFVAITYFLVELHPERGRKILKMDESQKPTIKLLKDLCPIDEISFRELVSSVKVLKDYFKKTRSKSLSITT